MLTKSEAQKLAAKLLSYSQFPDCSVGISESEQAYIRFANNGVTTSAFAVERIINISSTRDNRTGSVQISGTGDDELRAAVRRSEQMAATAPVNPEYMEPVGLQQYSAEEHWDEATAHARGDSMAPQVKVILERAEAKRLVAAGFFIRGASASAIANKKGNFGYARSTDARLTTTVRRPDGSSSGWAGQPSVRLADINGAEMARRAIEKCLSWMSPARLEPGKYTVVLEPTAVSDLVSLLGGLPFQARAADEGRSFLSKKGGGTLVGEKLFPESISLYTDPFDARLPTSTWSSDSLPNRRISWIEKGVVKNTAYDRYWASKTGQQPTPYPNSLKMDGGEASLQDLIASTERGLLVTRFWYIRLLNPQTVQATGLTRDGLFLIENGKVTRPVTNLRFNESPVRLLQNVKKLGRAERARGGEGQGMIAPPMQAADFTFSSFSDAI